MTPPAMAAVGVDLAADTGTGRIAEDEEEPEGAEAARADGVDEPEMAFEVPFAAALPDVPDVPEGRVEAEEGAPGKREAAPLVAVEPPVEEPPGDVAGDPPPDAGDVGDPGDEGADAGFGVTRK